jgi:hypothetical protein
MQKPRFGRLLEALRAGVSLGDRRQISQAVAKRLIVRWGRISPSSSAKMR